MKTHTRNRAIFPVGATLMTLALVAAATPVNGMTSTEPYVICRNVTDLYEGFSDGHLTGCEVLQGVDGERVDLDWIGNIELQGVFGHSLLRAIHNFDPSGFVPDDGGTGADAILDAAGGAAGSGGGGVNVCSPAMIVCAMAGADSHWEVLGNTPDMGVMMTMGGGQSGSDWGGHADIHTSLGNAVCDFSAWAGCLRNWQNIKTHGCDHTEAHTIATSDLLGIQAPPADYYDYICERA